jgi:predicted nucleic acid-binding protein
LKIALDTNVLVAYVTEDHFHHVPTFAACNRHLRLGDQFVIPEHVLLEAFSVLTRAPLPIKLPPSVAEKALRATFGDALTAPLNGLAWKTIRRMVDLGQTGGRVYDAMIALSAFEAGATVLLTWNVRHFLSITPPGLEIRTPEAI